MTLSRVAMVGILLANCPVLIRIVFGPFHIYFVVFVCYLYRVVLIFTIHLFTLKTFLASAFVIDFDKMSGDFFLYF